MSTKNDVKKIILTTEEFSDVKDKLEELKAQIYKTDFNLEDYMDKNFTKEEKDLVSNDIDAKSTPADLEKSIESALKNMSDMETVLIKLPFEPTVSFIKWIKEFIEEKTSATKSNLVIKIETDKSLLAGVYIEFRGKIKSHSVKNEILNILSVNK